MMRALVFAAIVSFAGVALANDVDAARAAFEKGAALASESRWSDALAQFEASAKLRPHAQTYYNIGYCERALGQATRARKAFALALARSSELTPELRASIEKYLAEVRALIATPQLTVLPAGAAITIDGRPLEADGDRFLGGTRAPGPGEPVPNPTFILEIDAGAHEIVVIAPDGRSKIANESFTAGDTRKVTIDVGPPPKAKTVIAMPPPEPSSRGTVGLVLTGVGVVSLGVGTYFGFAARSTWSDAKDACPERTTCPNEDGARLSTSAQRKANVATFTLVGGGLATAAGIILYLTAPRGPALTATPTTTGGVVSFTTAF